MQIVGFPMRRLILYYSSTFYIENLSLNTLSVATKPGLCQTWSKDWFYHDVALMINFFKFVRVNVLCPQSTAKVMSGQSVILATLFLDTPPKGRLSVLSAH